MPGRQLVIAQCFTNDLYVENENGLGKLKSRVAHKLEHTHRDTHTTVDGDQIGQPVA